MMSKAYRPNTASIPNILFDYWMAKLSPAEFKVLMAIARKTYGWNKQRDRISLRQLTDLTGLHKTGVIKATEKLIELSLVIKIKFKDEFDGSDAPNQYEINTDCEDEGVENNEGGSRHSRQGVVDTVDTPRVDTVDTQNTLYTKHTKQKKEREGAPSPRAPSSKKIQRTQDVFTTDEEHADLLKSYGLEHTQAFYTILQEWKEDTAKAKWKRNDYKAILRWVVQAYNERRGSAKGRDGPDRNLAEKIWNKWKGRNDIHLGPDYLEFVQGVNAPSIFLKFGAKGFREECLNQLRKRKLKTEDL